MSDMLRITGLATGLDVDSLVQSMMKAESAKLDKVKQDRQLTQWKQDLYREIIGDLNTFKSTYFDALKTDTYMLTSNNYAGFDIAAYDVVNNTASTNITSTKVTASASAGATPGTYKIEDVTLAATARSVGGAIKTKEAPNSIKFPINITSQNRVLDIKVGGTDFESIAIDVDGDTGARTYSSLSDLAANINAKLAISRDKNRVEGDDNVKIASSSVSAIVSDDGTKIEFSPVVTVKDGLTIKIPSGGNNYNITLNGGSYTLKDLSVIINKQLKNAIPANGTTPVDLVDKVKASVSPDGQSISFSDLNNAPINVTIDNTTSSTAFNTTMEITYHNSTTSTQTNEMSYGIKIDGSNNKFTIVQDGMAYIVELDSAIYKDLNELKDGNADGRGLLDALKRAKPANDPASPGVDLTGPGHGLMIGLSDDGTRLQFINNSVTDPTAHFSISGVGAKTLGFSTSSITDLYSSQYDRMSSLFYDVANDSNGVVKFTINNQNFTYNFLTSDKSRTINDIINDISSRAGVKVSYSELGQKFTLESSTTGSDQTITAVDSTGTFLHTLFDSDPATNKFTVGSTPLTGSDATATITDPNGTSSKVSRSTNSFTVDGVTYNLLSGFKTNSPDPGDPSIAVNIIVTQNTQKTFDKIKAFIDKYNEIIDKINTKLNEKRQYKYLPLTDEQKKDMKDDDIKNWEEKAKEGLLGNDTPLENMLTSLRNAFFDPVKVNYYDPDTYNIGVSLSDIGLSTSSDITQRGKIIIDESKLKDAIKNNGSKIVNLFTKVSVTERYYNPNATDRQRDERYQEEGITQRINDILQDNLRTLRNNYGQKGTLLEIAGIKGDFTEYSNILTDELISKDKTIDDLNKRLADKEEEYYMKFSRLETAMQQLNAQSNWLMQQLGSSGGGQ